MAALSPGKRRGLERIADAQGRFRMLAIDQRGSLSRMLSKRLGCAEKDVPDQAFRDVKRAVTVHLAKHGSGLLTDPFWGYASAMDTIGRDVGLLLCIDQSGPMKVGRGKSGQVSALLEDFSIEQTKLAGADAVKILLPYRPDATDGSCAFQEHYVRQIGKECDRWQIPFVLEIVAYELNEPGKDSPEYAAGKPKWVIESARVFSRPEFRADVLKLEFPAELKTTKEFADGRFDGKKRDPLYTTDEVKGFCREVDAATGKPWVILSAGVGIDEFVVNVELCSEAGASGFLCGRAIWKDAVDLYPDTAKMDAFLGETGAEYFERVNAAASKARPWFDHPGIGGRDRLSLSS